ncbi:hypothetical protein [Acinetobacter wuhouensis]|uniref:Uncharacterized protein n=1 Tax=Acinetobacter wuhouensis TaxID=1879050 RepID=A0A4Q7ACZ4_9GAMM|nr:hypothetical protein [Acinetobacter wuhouensis]RZG44033.1 hypothetical protein EXU28_15765 [Acinetobacter wuhouensis]RZG71402.1 hypothetical protein EXU29_14200 [Acinetobacter wuhouensis]
MEAFKTLRVVTSEGNCFAVFPQDALHCELKGFNAAAIYYFESNMFKMFKQHGYPIVLEDINFDSFLMYCNRPDLGVLIEDEFVDEEYDMCLGYQLKFTLD